MMHGTMTAKLLRRKARCIYWHFISANVKVCFILQIDQKQIFHESVYLMFDHTLNIDGLEDFLDKV